MKKYEVKLKEDVGIFGMSLVKNPANQTKFICLSEDKVNLKLSNDEEMIVTGVALIPDQPIYRNSSFVKGECEIYFSAETIKEASKLFLSTNSKDNATINHALDTDKVDLVESWIVEDSECDKALTLGFEVPKGTWMISYKVKDLELWEAIKNGDINGFSIESDVEGLIEMSNHTSSEEATQEDYDKLSIEISEMFRELQMSKHKN